MEKYLVTGGCGFIGSALIDNLINTECEILLIDNLSSGFLSNISDSPKIKFIQESVQDISNINLDQLDGIFHLAAQTSVPRSIKNFYQSSKNNLLSSIKIFDLAQKKNLPVVYASSSAVYGNIKLGNESDEEYDIMSPYAQDKLTLEHFAKMVYGVYGVPSIGLRFFNVYGPKQDSNNPYSGVISIFINNLLTGQPIIINGGYQTRDFIFVDDVVDVMVQSLKKLKNQDMCEVLNVGTGKSITIDELLLQLINLTNTEPKIIRKTLKAGDPERSSGNYHKLNDILNIDKSTFLNIKDGLIRTIDFIKNNNL